MENDKLIVIIENIFQEIVAKEELLTNLDNKIGDGDHGLNMKRGFQFVVNAIKEQKPCTPKETLTLVGRTLLSKVGGASGPLYGMMFIKGASQITSKNLDWKGFTNFILEANKVTEKLGRTNLNDKTLFDVWKRLENDLIKGQQEDKNMILVNLKKYSDMTKNMKALKGRSSYLGERSIGTIDPGSVSSVIILSNFFKEL